MKKLIAVSVALALVAGSAFAELRISGDVEIGVNLVQGGNEYGMTGDGDESDVVGRGTFARGRIRADFTTDAAIGTFGAMARLDGRFHEWGDGDRYTRLDAHVWWRPVDMFRLGIGRDIGFLTGGMGLIPFHRGGAHVDLVVGDSQRGGSAVHHERPFIGDLGNGLAFEFLPMGDMLNIAVGLEYDWIHYNQSGTAPEVADIFRGVFARAFVNLDGIGRIGFGYVGGSAVQGVVATWSENDDPTNIVTTLPGGAVVGSGSGEWTVVTVGVTEFTDPGALYAYFRSNELVDGLDVHFGLRFGMATSTGGESDNNAELALGLGVNFDVDPDLFGVRFRTTVALGIGDGWRTSNQATRMSFELLPYFFITPDVLFNFYAGIGLDMPHGDVENVDPRVWWAINPYLSINVGAPRFLVGFQVYGNNGSDPARENAQMNWAIPIGMVVNF